MARSRPYRGVSGPQRRRLFNQPVAVSQALWKRAECCGAVVAADPDRMGAGKSARLPWADVHEPGCPVPWQLAGLPGEPREVYPGAPYIPAGMPLRAVNRRARSGVLRKPPR